MVAAGERQSGFRRQCGAGLIDALAAGKDLAGEDQRLCLGPAFGEPLLDQQLIRPDLCSRPPAAMRRAPSPASGGGLGWGLTAELRSLLAEP
jgi:hypothetical protein